LELELKQSDSATSNVLESKYICHRRSNTMGTQLYM
jgi:hypothetical protein